MCACVRAFLLLLSPKSNLVSRVRAFSSSSFFVVAEMTR